MEYLGCFGVGVERFYSERFSFSFLNLKTNFKVGFSMEFHEIVSHFVKFR
jgi:hypothetical protein